MHEGSPYGYLKVADKVILPANLARMVGETLEVVEGWLHELHEAGVYDIDNGAIFSRRMIRDEELRQKRAEGGKLGGNPKLKVNHVVILKDNQKSTPSSTSTSTSTSSKKKESATSVACPDSVSQQVWDDWMTVRKEKKAKTLTETGWNGFVKQVEKAGWSLEQAISHCCLKQWVGFEAAWVAPKANSADIVRVTVPPSNLPDPALQKIKEDEKRAAPIPLEVLAKMAALRAKA
jgi:hypothetical protein